MAQEIGWASLGVVPTLDRGFDSKLSRQLDPALGRVGARSGKLFGSALGKAAVAVSAGIIGAGFAAIKLGKASFAEAEEALKVGKLTTSTLKATGGAANVSAKQIGNLSNQLSQKAAVDDEVIQSGLNMLLTFKNVRNEVGKGDKIFNRAAKATTDMAAAMAASSGGDLDLKSASIQLGKALNDPIKGITALSRVGVTFTEQQKANIQALVDQGDTLGAQKIILRELNSEFGGAAASQATAWDRLGVAWGNAEEKLGTALLPLVKDAARFLRREAIPAFEQYADTFEKKGIPALEHFVKKAKPVAEDVLPKLADVLGTVKDDLALAAPYAKDLVDAFAGMPDWAKKVIVGGGLAAFAGSKLGLGSALTGGKGGGSGLLGLVSKAKPLPVFVVNGGLGGAGGSGIIPELGGKGGKAPGGLGPKLPGLLSFIGTLGFGAATAGGAFDKGYMPPGAPSDEDLKAQIDASVAKRKVSATEFWAPVIDALNGSGNAISKADQRLLFGATVDASDAELKIRKLRESASEPIEIPIVAKLNDSISQLFADAFGGTAAPSTTSGDDHRTPRRGGVNINIGRVEAHDYKDLMRQLDQRAQQNSIGGIGAMAS